MPNTNGSPVNLKLGGAHYMGRGTFIDDGGYRGPKKFFDLLRIALNETQTRYHEKMISIDQGLFAMRTLFQCAHDKDRKIIFVGNGGSGAIASHMAVDYTKNGGIRAIAFNDVPTVLCLANDFGFDRVFSKQLEFYSHSGDVVVIISSSGKSSNILRAAEAAFKLSLDLVTFSGQNPNNVLRSKGILGFYVPALDYGLVELAHLTLLHSVVNIHDNL